jgi:hypothetical protein
MSNLAKLKNIVKYPSQCFFHEKNDGFLKNKNKFGFFNLYF